jgi:hypothetical protein
MLDEERQRRDSLARELASARDEIDALKRHMIAAVEAEAASGARILAEQRRVLDHERERADALARELVTARGQIEAAKERMVSLLRKLRPKTGAGHSERSECSTIAAARPAASSR